MPKAVINTEFTIRKITIEDIKEIYKLLIDNRPYVGLNSRYTYFLLAKDFSDTCIVALDGDKVIAFSSGYLPPKRPDTFFNWEIVVQKDYRGKGLQKTLLLKQIKMTGAKYFEGTINPSNKVSKKNFFEIARLLKTECKTHILFTEEDFENDGHEKEILCRIGPITKDALQNCFRDTQ